MGREALLPRALLRRGRGAVSRWLRPALDARAPTGLLTGEQLTTLRAFAEVIVTGAPLSDEEWEPVRAALVADARGQPGFRALCVRACRLLDRVGEGRFAAAALGRRTAWIAAARLAAWPVPGGELLALARRPYHEVRELVVPALIRAYWDSPAGWAAVGYDAPLGECRDPWAYTRKPA